MKKKAQMSLEMIIGLLILVVVAVVVIRAFLEIWGKSPVERWEKRWEDTTEFKEFETRCKSFCRDFSSSPDNLGHAVSFCISRFWQEGTKNKVGDIAKVDKIDITKGTPLISPWPVCEDAIFCFHLFNCSEYGTTITMEDCRRILCKYYSQMYSDINTLNQKVIETMKGKAKYPYGSCELGRENWFTRYFFNPNGTGPCEGII